MTFKSDKQRKAVMAKIMGDVKTIQDDEWNRYQKVIHTKGLTDDEMDGRIERLALSSDDRLSLKGDRLAEKYDIKSLGDVLFMAGDFSHGKNNALKKSRLFTDWILNKDKDYEVNVGDLSRFGD